eukprot:gene32297-16863_t
MLVTSSQPTRALVKPPWPKPGSNYSYRQSGPAACTPNTALTPITQALMAMPWVKSPVCRTTADPFWSTAWSGLGGEEASGSSTIADSPLEEYESDRRSESHPCPSTGRDAGSPSPGHTTKWPNKGHRYGQSSPGADMSVSWGASSGNAAMLGPGSSSTKQFADGLRESEATRGEQPVVSPHACNLGSGSGTQVGSEGSSQHGSEGSSQRGSEGGVPLTDSAKRAKNCSKRGKSDLVTPMELVGRIKAASYWQELEQIVSCHEAEMSMINISALVSLGYCPSQALLDRFLFASYICMDSLKRQEMSNIAWALGTMHHHPPQHWADRFYQHSAKKLDHMKPQELANLAWALPRMGFAPPLDFTSHICNASMQKLAPAGSWSQTEAESWQPGSKRVSGVSNNIIPGMGLSHSPSTRSLGFPQELRQASPPLNPPTASLETPNSKSASPNSKPAHASRQSFKPCELIMLLGGVCSLPGGIELAGKHKLLHASWDWIMERMPHMNRLELVNWISLMAKIEYHPQDACDSFGSARYRSSKSSTSSASKAEIGQALSTSYGPVFEASLRDMPWGTPQSLTRTAWAVAKLGLQPPPTWSQALLAELSSRRYSLSKQGLAMALWSVSRMGVQPPCEWLDSMLRIVTLQLPAFSTRELAAICCSLGKYGYTPSPVFASSLCEAVSKKLPLMRDLEIGTILRGLALAKIDIPPPVMASFLEGGTQSRAGDCRESLSNTNSTSTASDPQAPSTSAASPRNPSPSSPETIHGRVMLLSALSGYPSHQLPPDWLHEIEVALSPDVGQLDAKHIVMVLDSYARVARQCSGYASGLDTCGLPDAKLIHEVLHAAQSYLAEFSPGQVSQILHALAVIRFQPSMTWMESCYAEIEARLHEFEVDEVSHVFWALARLSLPVPKQLFISCIRMVYPKISTASPKAVARMMWSLPKIAKPYILDDEAQNAQPGSIDNYLGTGVSSSASRSVIDRPYMLVDEAQNAQPGSIDSYFGTGASSSVIARPYMLNNEALKAQAGSTDSYSCTGASSSVSSEGSNREVGCEHSTSNRAAPPLTHSSSHEPSTSNSTSNSSYHEPDTSNSTSNRTAPPPFNSSSHQPSTSNSSSNRTVPPPTHSSSHEPRTSNRTVTPLIHSSYHEPSTSHRTAIPLTHSSWHTSMKHRQSKRAESVAIRRAVRKFRFHLVKRGFSVSRYLSPDELIWMLHSSVLVDSFAGTVYMEMWDRLMRDGVLPRIQAFSPLQTYLLFRSLATHRWLHHCCRNDLLALAQHAEAPESSKQLQADSQKRIHAATELGTTRTWS